MPIRKFRSIQEMSDFDARARPVSEEDRDDRIAKLWRTATTLADRHYPPGVYRFRNQQEAEDHRLEMLRRHAHRDRD